MTLALQVIKYSILLALEALYYVVLRIGIVAPFMLQHIEVSIYTAVFCVILTLNSLMHWYSVWLLIHRG